MAENCMCQKCLCTNHPSAKRNRECKQPSDWHGNPEGCTLSLCLCCKAEIMTGGEEAWQSFIEQDRQMNVARLGEEYVEKVDVAFPRDVGKPYYLVGFAHGRTSAERELAKLREVLTPVEEMLKQIIDLDPKPWSSMAVDRPDWWQFAHSAWLQLDALLAATPSTEGS